MLKHDNSRQGRENKSFRFSSAYFSSNTNPTEMLRWKEESQWWRRISGVMSAEGCMETGDKDWRSKGPKREYRLEKGVKSWVTELCHELMCPDGPVELSEKEMSTVLKSSTKDMRTGQEQTFVSCKQLVYEMEARSLLQVCSIPPKYIAASSMILGLQRRRVIE